MTINSTTLVPLIAGAVLSVLCAASASAQDYKPTDVSARVRNQCTSDAMRLCPQHPLGSNQMVYCMEAKSAQISRDCQAALEDDGVVPRNHFRRRS